MSNIHKENFNNVVNEMNKLWNKEVDLNQSFSEKRCDDINKNKKNKISGNSRTNNQIINNVKKDNSDNLQINSSCNDDLQKNNLNNCKVTLDNNIIESNNKSYDVDDVKKDNLCSLNKNVVDIDNNVQKKQNDLLKIEELCDKIEPYLDIIINKNYKGSLHYIHDADLNELLNYISRVAENNNLDNKENINKYKENSLFLYLHKKKIL